jgi:hypothetical protein
MRRQEAIAGLDVGPEPAAAARSATVLPIMPLPTIPVGCVTMASCRLISARTAATANRPSVQLACQARRKPDREWRHI